MRLARKLALTATLCASVVAALPAGAQQEVNPTHFPLETEAAPPSHQQPAVAKKSKPRASSSALSHQKPDVKPIAKRRTTASLKPAVSK